MDSDVWLDFRGFCTVFYFSYCVNSSIVAYVGHVEFITFHLFTTVYERRTVARDRLVYFSSFFTTVNERRIEARDRLVYFSSFLLLFPNAE